VEDKDRRPATEVESDRTEAPVGRVYDIDSDSPEPVSDVPGGESADPDEAAPAAPAAADTGRRHSLKVSGRDILGRMAEKNSAIGKLQKEKTALEKSLETERAERAAEKEAIEAQARDFKDRWMRSAAEFENYRKRTAREWELLKQQSRTEVILEVLNSLDDFERAFAVVGEGAESEFVKGIRLIYNNLLQVLQKLGVGEIDALHQPFDPMNHMAIGQIDATGVASGHVAQVIAKGYTLNGSVIRPAHVIVAK
jgi:molecular chaperone GrpE